MSRTLLLASFVASVLLVATSLQTPLEAGAPAAVQVTNFPELQSVEGEVWVERPIPATRLLLEKAQVSPGDYANPNSYHDAGVIDVSGFSSATLSLAGQVQGQLGQVSEVGALLVPEVHDVQEALRVHGVHQFTLREQSRVGNSRSGLFHSEQSIVRLGFPRYRVYFYNSTPRTVNANLYIYLSQ